MISPICVVVVNLFCCCFCCRSGWQKVVMPLNWTVLFRLIPANLRISVVKQEKEDIKCDVVHVSGSRNNRKKAVRNVRAGTYATSFARSNRLTEVVLNTVRLFRISAKKFLWSWRKFSIKIRFARSKARTKYDGERRQGTIITHSVPSEVLVTTLWVCH